MPAAAGISGQAMERGFQVLTLTYTL